MPGDNAVNKVTTRLRTCAGFILMDAEVGQGQWTPKFLLPWISWCWVTGLGASHCCGCVSGGGWLVKSLCLDGTLVLEEAGWNLATLTPGASEAEFARGNAGAWAA